MSPQSPKQPHLFCTPQINQSRMHSQADVLEMQTCFLIHFSTENHIWCLETC